MRTCAKCGITDDAPRDVLGSVDGSTLVNFHLDCHALMGCPICIHQLSGANGAKDDDLRAYLLTLDPLTPEQVANLKNGVSNG